MNPTDGRSCEEFSSQRPSRMRKFAGWEGRFTPARDSQPLNNELVAQDEWLRILSGGKPPFPTCKLPTVDQYPGAHCLAHRFMTGQAIV